MTSVRRVVAASIIAGVAVLVPRAAFADEPTVSVAPTASLGTSVHVTGTGWTVGDVVQIELCGNEARNGSSDCALQSAVAVGVREGGVFGGVLHLTQPPMPCACVVRVTSGAYGQSATAPINLIGAPSTPGMVIETPVPEIRRAIEVVRAEVHGNGPILALFGGAPERTLELTLRNVGSVTLNDPPLDVTVGKGDDPTGMVEHIPPIGDLAPGEEVVVRVPFELPVFAIGGYTVRGEIAGFGDPVVFTARTATYPWALLAGAGIVLLQTLLVRARDRVRAALERRGELHGDERAELDTERAPDIDLTTEEETVHV